jgi:hypothetical protein
MSVKGLVDRLRAEWSVLLTLNQVVGIPIGLAVTGQQQAWFLER